MRRDVFADRCVAGIEAERERCDELVEQSLAMCTASRRHRLRQGRAIAKEAYKTGKTVREIALEKKILSGGSG